MCNRGGYCAVRLACDKNMEDSTSGVEQARFSDAVETVRGTAYQIGKISRVVKIVESGSLCDNWERCVA